jgi:hypothetical protein
LRRAKPHRHNALEENPEPSDQNKWTECSQRLGPWGRGMTHRWNVKSVLHDEASP